MEAQKGDEWGMACFLLLTGGTAALVYVFIFQRAELVGNWGGFLGLIVCLILLSFLLSAVEAGFSAAPKDAEITGKIIAELAARAQKVAETDKAVQDAGGDIAKSLGPRRRNEAAVRRWERFKKKEANLVGSRRIQFVGALSAANVVANTALATFLPIFVHRLPGGTSLFGPEKMMIFVASALPLLYLGKIVPKMIGLQHPFAFAYRFYWVGGICNLAVGWIPRGLAYLLIKLGLMKAEA